MDHLLDAVAFVLTGLGFACLTVFLFYSRIAQPLAFSSHNYFKMLLKRWEREEEESEEAAEKRANGETTFSTRKEKQIEQRLKEKHVESKMALAVAINKIGNTFFILGLTYLFVIVILVMFFANGGK